LLAFARNGTHNGDALVVNNLETVNRDVTIQITGTQAQSFDAYITGFYKKYYAPLGTFPVRNGVLKFSIPKQSVITFFAKQ